MEKNSDPINLGDSILIKTVDCYSIGQMERLKREFTKAEVNQWSLLTLDVNAVHQHPDLLNTSLVPGTLGEGLITEAISKMHSCSPCVLKEKELLFIEPVQIGHTITAEIEIIDVNHNQNWITEKVRCINEQGDEVIKGKIILKLLS
ncbi:MaoC/PaaZ C-terminal domain-containing protein [Metabacillus rhizolycopersici]|uniref:MaoC-like domain-containing protein n=1 Tax=Metabacillus rhizolycopersici TaxID=2875709 RepID=A0ABS7UNN6_9BACI|nr:MaoC/PaaZ C-terminal domain-containing protein [Metabacillus rhizolycopersici]MBZ5749930.1 hypothetical protein [Metabacillus rhizolycopersici]